MQILYSLIGSLLIAIVVSSYFYFSSNKTAGQLAIIIIKETTKQDVKPIFNWYGKLIGIHRIKVFNDVATARETVIKIVKPE
jgi:hypothetical protein